jgi:hypothetical protein
MNLGPLVIQKAATTSADLTNAFTNHRHTADSVSANEKFSTSKYLLFPVMQ